MFIEIITGLKKGGKRPLRPDVHEDSFESPELLSLMMTCWAENPSERPTFTEINETFRRLKNKRYNFVVKRHCELDIFIQKDHITLNCTNLLKIGDTNFSTNLA